MPFVGFDFSAASYAAACAAVLMCCQVTSTVDVGVAKRALKPVSVWQRVAERAAGHLHVTQFHPDRHRFWCVDRPPSVPHPGRGAAEAPEAMLRHQAAVAAVAGGPRMNVRVDQQGTATCPNSTAGSDGDQRRQRLNRRQNLASRCGLQVGDDAQTRRGG
jgi:hypothetical protein